MDAPPIPTNSSINALNRYVGSVRNDYEKALKSLVDIAGVSMDASFQSEILKTADRACRLLKNAGAQAQVIETSGYPVVYGELISDRKNPTITVYNHMDVQPADPAEWKTPPFNMTIEDGIYRGRGTTDDKGPALAALFAAKFVHEQKVPINIKFIWELEEENGSKSFAQFLRQNKSKLITDSIVVSDTIWVSKDQPAIAYGLRGLQGFTVKLKTGAKDVHSGTTGGLARNPIGELAQLISECYDAQSGHVKIPGFYDHVEQISESEINDFVRSGLDLEYFKKAHELISLRTTDAKEASKRIWAMPTFEVHGIAGGYTGAGVKTIVPHEAEAKITMRLVPHQNPDKIITLFTDFVKAKCPDARVQTEGTLSPYLSDRNGVYMRAAANAMHKAFGTMPAFTREGGSIGAVVSMHNILKAPIIFLGLSLPEHGYHAINEYFDWRQASGGIKMFVHYFESLANIHAGAHGDAPAGG